MRPLLAAALAAALAGSATAGPRDDRYAMQMVRLALSTGRWAEGTVANGVEPLAAYRDMVGYLGAGRDLLPRYELPAGWGRAIDLALTLPGPVLPGAADEGGLDGAEALAVTYARAAALERALPRRRLTPDHATPEAVRRVLVEVASAVPVGVSPELKARCLAQGARYVADVAAEHAWAGHPAEAARLRVAADASAAAPAAQRLRFLEIVLSSHRDPILDGRDLARDTMRAFFEIPGRPDDARRAWELAVLDGVVLALVDHLPVEDPARFRLKEAFEDSHDWDSKTRHGHLTRQFWNASGV